MQIDSSCMNRPSIEFVCRNIKKQVKKINRSQILHYKIQRKSAAANRLFLRLI